MPPKRKLPVNSSENSSKKRKIDYKAKAIEKQKEFTKWKSTGSDKDGMFIRNYALSPLFYLRASKYDEGFEEDELEESTDSEIEQDKKDGEERWKLLLENLEQATKLANLETIGPLVEENFHTFGYGQTKPFCFSVPPSYTDSIGDEEWCLTDIFLSSHPKEEEEVNRLKIFEPEDKNAIDGFVHNSMNEFFTHLKKKANKDKEDDKDKEEALKSIENFQKEFESLECSKDLQWSPGSINLLILNSDAKFRNRNYL